MCASFRRAARALTNAYDEALRPLGLRTPQFTLLQVLSLVGEASQGQIGRILAMDSTTLTRTMRILARRGWIAERRGTDKRERLLRLAEAGQKQFKRAEPAWERMQAELRQRLGAERWADLFQLMGDVTDIATTSRKTERK